MRYPRTNYHYAGFTLRNYEYQRYDTGATAFFPPLRFPGQYYDDETHLHENWNRFYDPVVGRYLQPEPLLSVVAGPTSVAEVNDEEDVPVELLRKYGGKGGPAFVLEHAKEGRVPPAYSYAFNNPLKFIDPDGRGPADVALINCEWKCGVPVDEAYTICLGDVASGDKKNRPGARRTKGDCGLVRDRLIRDCRSSCRKKHPLDGGGGGCK